MTNVSQLIATVQRSYAVMLITAGVFFGACACGSGRDDSRPRIAFDGVKTDVGRVVQGETVRATFGFANVGSGELVLENVEGTCQCTAVLNGPMRVPVGERGTITAVIDTRWMVPGGTTKDIIVTSNDPVLSRVTLTVTGTIVGEFAIDRPVLDFGATSSASSPSQEVVVESVDGSVVMTGASSEDPRIRVSLRAGATPGTTVVRAVQATNADVGWYTGAVVVKTSSKSMPEFRIPLRGRVIDGTSR